MGNICLVSRFPSAERALRGRTEFYYIMYAAADEPVARAEEEEVSLSADDFQRC